MTTELMNPKYSEISKLLSAGIQCFVDAGKIIVELIESGDTIAAIAKEAGVTTTLIARLEVVGRKGMIPELLLANYSSAQALRKLPYSEQLRLTHEPVELVVINDGKPDVLNVDAKALMPSQSAQVFCGNAVRTPAEQRAWLAAQSAKKPRVTTQSPEYTIGRGEVKIHRQCNISRQQLVRILSEIG